MFVIPPIDANLQQSVVALAKRMEQVLFEVKRVIVGQDHLLENVLIALLARGHLLVEGMPGLAKTLTVNTLAQALQAQFKRIQFTPDLMPADLIGSRIFHPRDAVFQTLLGPVFANLLLADEINRAPPKVQSALLEAMQEADQRTHPQSGRPGDDRRTKPRTTKALCGDGNPKPYRNRGNLSASGSAGRSFHDENHH